MKDLASVPVAALEPPGYPAPPCLGTEATTSIAYDASRSTSNQSATTTAAASVTEPRCTSNHRKSSREEFCGDPRSQSTKSVAGATPSRTGSRTSSHTGKHSSHSGSLRRQRTLHEDNSTGSTRRRGESVKSPKTHKDVQRSNTISETDSVAIKQKAEVSRSTEIDYIIIFI